MGGHQANIDQTLGKPRGSSGSWAVQSTNVGTRYVPGSLAVLLLIGYGGQHVSFPSPRCRTRPVDSQWQRFLYNDSRYLAERLAELATSWKLRDDLSPRAKTMLRLDNEIKTLQKFANRSYSSEMNTQKTILRDLLGGTIASAPLCQGTTDREELRPTKPPAARRRGRLH